MFERNKVDSFNHQTQQAAVQAEVTFDSGEVVAGQFLIHASRPFAEVLNGSSPFVEFEVYGQQRRWIAKSTIRDVALVAVPRAMNLASRHADGDGFDPYRVLNVEPNSEWTAVKSAYHTLSKTYHPDRFASTDLPPEVRDYLASMSRRINLAYSALETKHTQVKAVQNRAAPIYESRPRA